MAFSSARVSGSIVDQAEFTVHVVFASVKRNGVLGDGSAAPVPA